MKDGLYRVVSKYFVAGYLVKDGKIIKVASILKKKINYWITKGELISGL